MRQFLSQTQQSARQRRSCGGHWQRSYSDHNTQKCGTAGTDGNDSDNRSCIVDIRLQRPQCPAGLDSCGNAVLVVHLCVCVLQRGCVLLRVLQSAVVILAKAWRGFLVSWCGAAPDVIQKGQHRLSMSITVLENRVKGFIAPISPCERSILLRLGSESSLA
jgi:hypothetical protein